MEAYACHSNLNPLTLHSRRLDPDRRTAVLSGESPILVHPGMRVSPSIANPKPSGLFDTHSRTSLAR